MTDAFVGEIRMFASNFPPRLWSFCSGSILNPVQNEALFSLIGSSYGGDGRTSFALPSLMGRLPVHQGNGAGLTPRAIASTYGSETITLTAQQTPIHQHILQASQDSVDKNTPENMVLATSTDQDVLYKTFFDQSGVAPMASDSVMNAGANQSHSNMMPFQCLSFIICMMGIYPSRN